MNALSQHLMSHPIYGSIVAFLSAAAGYFELVSDWLEILVLIAGLISAILAGLVSLRKLKNSKLETSILERQAEDKDV